MVRPWDIELKKAIQRTKTRIKHCEAHGIGSSAIQEKEILKKQERKLTLRREDTGRKI